MPKAAVGDLSIAYEANGDGPPLLLIMGFGANLDWWDPRLVQGLSRDFRVIRFDNRGTGRSDDPAGQYTMRQLADDAAGLLDALAIPRAHVFGMSMGGMIAQELALGHPEKVGRLVLGSTHCGGSHAVPPSPEALGILARIPGAASGEEAARLTLQLCFSKEAMREEPAAVEAWAREAFTVPTSRETLRRQQGAMMSFDSYGRLPTMTIPTLVLAGARDILIPPENGAVLAKAIAHAQLIRLEHSAHGLTEDMPEVLRSVRAFLRSPP